MQDRYRLVQGGLSREELGRLSRQCEEKAEKDRTKLEQMMLYGQSAGCRWKFLHDYLNEEFDIGSLRQMR